MPILSRHVINAVATKTVQPQKLTPDRQFSLNHLMQE